MPRFHTAGAALTGLALLGPLMLFTGSTGSALAPSSAAGASLVDRPPDVTVDFAAAVRPVASDAFSLDVTGYGNGRYITNDAALRDKLRGRYGAMRMELRYERPGDPRSRIVCGGAGCDASVDGAAWIRSIRELGARPVIIVPERADDAANLVRHFNRSPTLPAGGPVARWVIGNEPDMGGRPASDYSASFNRVFDAMRAVDPTVQVGGPAQSWPNLDYLRVFLRGSGSRVSFVDFHKYGEGKPPGGTGILLCDAQLLANTRQWGDYARQVRQVLTEIVPARAASIGIQVGELNSSWSVDDNPPEKAGCTTGTEPVQYRNAAVWWGASVFGHLVGAGASGYLYGDKNGALGAVYDLPNKLRPPYARNGASLNERTAVSNGLGFFTGQEGTGLARFGRTLVKAVTTLPDVEVWASRDPRVVVLVNKGTAPRSAVVQVGSAASAVVHQKDGLTVSYAKPANKGTVPVSDGRVSVNLPGPSVTQLAVTGSAPAPTPSPVAGNPIAGARFRANGPDSNAGRTAARNRTSDPARAAQFDKIANGSQARWWGDWNPVDQVRGQVNADVDGHAAVGTLPVYVVYNVPLRDLGSYSAGGAPSLPAYRAWVDQVALGLGGRKAAVVLEPDAVPGMPQMAADKRAERGQALRYAVDKLTAAGAVVYLDAGHSGWHPVSTTTALLNEAGLQGARGFALNTSNFQTTSSSTAYGEQVSRAAGGGKSFVVDTSRNGNGPSTDGEYWCNPPGRALGPRPSGNTGVALADAYLWVKAPGESDGSCRGFPPAGQWVESYAYELAVNSTN